MGDSGESKNFCDQGSLLGQVEGRKVNHVIRNNLLWVGWARGRYNSGG